MGIQNTGLLKTERKSNFELLRIIAMLMIVFHHFAVQGNFGYDAGEISINHFWYLFIFMGGKVGVDLFVLISGYFLVDKEGNFLNWKRILKIWGQVFFYSVSLMVAFEITGVVKDFSYIQAIKSFFPITNELWWFASTYFVFYLLHPFINMLLKQLDKKTHQTLIFLLLAFWSVIPTLLREAFQGNNLLWFITLYVLAGYIKRYGLNAKIGAKKYFGLFIFFSLLTYLLSIGVTYLTAKNSIFEIFYYHFYGQNKLTIVLISVCLFMGFSKLDISYNKWINLIASTTFGIYLFHDSRQMKIILWYYIFQNATFKNSDIMPLYSIGVSILVFILSFVVDLIRQGTVEKIFDKFLDAYCDRFTDYLGRIINKLKTVVFGE